MPGPVDREPLYNILPPLIFGCGTFNVQYNKDPFALDSVGLVKQALASGIRAFDTSPYYGPSEEILSAALNSDEVRQTWPRDNYFILTKAGRIASEEFDYSPEWIRYSVKRSLQRFQTSYLDVVYCHDVEFVSPAEAVAAIKELRRIRDEERSIKYVGVSGYPLEVLCDIAERVVRETGEPLDVVQSYAQFTLQNTKLATHAVRRLRAAGVGVVPNASLLGMGLLRKLGPNFGTTDWHPSPSGLRASVKRASDFTEEHEEKLEHVALRYALEQWLRAGSVVGTFGDPASGVPWKPKETVEELGGHKLGVSVVGVSNKAELAKVLSTWRSILDGAENGQQLADAAGRWRKSHEWSLTRRTTIELLAEGVKDTLGDYYNYSWTSPPAGFINLRDRSRLDLEERWSSKSGTVSNRIKNPEAKSGE